MSKEKCIFLEEAKQEAIKILAETGKPASVTCDDCLIVTAHARKILGRKFVTVEGKCPDRGEIGFTPLSPLESK